MVKDNSVHALLLEQLDVLTLLYYICDIVNCIFLRLLVFIRGVCIVSFLCIIRSIGTFCICFFILSNRCEQLRKSLILVIDVLEKNIVVYLVTELLVL